ncbi:hypothetical protein BDR22DRAFT_889744 [Usnea florida]
MSWPVGAIIALVSLLVTCAPMLLIIWRFARQRRRATDTVSQNYTYQPKIPSPQNSWRLRTIRSYSSLEAAVIAHEGQPIDFTWDQTIPDLGSSRNSIA